ncbi:hypothetical protein ACIQOU_16600 [Streptomyces sp. NPDC091279]|uniref:hypothetical protein n=1 Tax=unclassified Streptomyces TaxID=2593676 RepID=UPI003803B71E
MNSKLFPDWVPRIGLQLRLAGVHFDAVRVGGTGGEAAVHLLAILTRGRPGPVVREVKGPCWTYFLLAPGAAQERDWPPGARGFGRSVRAEYIGVPAPVGNTYPLSWCSGAPGIGEFVDAELLHGVLSAELLRPPE